MRILFASTHKYLPELHGGMEINTHQLATRLLSAGISVGVLVGLEGRGRVGTLAKLQMKMLGRKWGRDHVMGYPVWRTYDPSAVADFVVDEFKPDAVVVQGGHEFIKLVSGFIKRKLPVIGYLHSHDRLLLDVDLSREGRLVFMVNSKFTASMHPEKRIVRVLPPIVPRRLYETETDRTAAVLINPSKYKGLDVVMGMARARPDIPFHLVMTKKKQRLEIEKLPNITITGPFDDMRKVYRNARVVLAPSQCDETWGRIATEAHVSGIPVLASTRGGLLEAVGPGGICLPHNSLNEEWVAALGKMWDDPHHYAQLSAAAADYAKRREIQPDALVNGFVEEVCAHVERVT
ncbi:hypothetical protein BI364_11615 [Acidihalobacter yilgarnensis]|uniref:Glycosyl transferase family 1 domain-containing protein n=1 Tax=Acidihalobacter yilgarnensis TaxID=2819280 RepID=A0A1D8IQ49_9GAMM|nr:glycosyltransferase [Acidihalobacter yilgarnensis]AOU98514.1 hypothetical protein BI364_11615 [Acidihalobacter yilgarnensis]